jgi:hypothetical protein
LNVHGVNEVRQTEIHTAEPLVPEPSGFEVEMATEKLKSHRSPGIDQILAELIKAEGSQFAEIHKFIIIIIIIIIIITIIEAYHFCQLHTKFIQQPAVKVNSTRRVKSNRRSSVWISTQQVSYCSYILHSSNT